MQLDPVLFIVSIRNDKIKLNYPHGDNEQHHHHLPIPPSSSSDFHLSSSTLTLTSVPPNCVTAALWIRWIQVRVVHGCRDTAAWLKWWFYSSHLHWQLKSGGMQAVRSFTFALPLPQVSGHTLDQARPHKVEELVPITPQCSIKQEGGKCIFLYLFLLPAVFYSIITVVIVSSFW